MHGVVCPQDSANLWSTIECGQLEVEGCTTLDLLLPNGFMVNVRCSMDFTLAMLKQELFIQAKKCFFSSASIHYQMFQLIRKNSLPVILLSGFPVILTFSS